MAWVVLSRREARKPSAGAQHDLPFAAGASSAAPSVWDSAQLLPFPAAPLLVASPRAANPANCRQAILLIGPCSKSLPVQNSARRVKHKYPKLFTLNETML